MKSGNWLEIESPVKGGKMSVEIPPETEWGDELGMLLSAVIPPALRDSHPEVAKARHIISIDKRFFDSEADEMSRIELHGCSQAPIKFEGFRRMPKIVGPVITAISVSAIENGEKKPGVLENIPIQAAFTLLHELGELTFRFATGMLIKDSRDLGTKNPYYSSTILEREADNFALGWLRKATGDKFVRTSGGVSVKGSPEKYRADKRRERLANLTSRYLASRKK